MSKLSAATPQELEAVIEVTRAVADAVRDLTELKGGVSSSELYMALMRGGMNLAQYGAVIEALEGAGVIEAKNHYIRFTGKTGGKA